jgi:MraZ protein
MANSYYSTQEYVLDAKGRIALPASIRLSVEAANRQADVVVEAFAAAHPEANKIWKSVGLLYNAANDCLDGFDLLYLAKRAQEIEGQAAGDPDTRDALSAGFFDEIMMVAYDSGGRIVVPEELRARAGFQANQTLRLVGGGYKFMIWHPARHEVWKARQAERRQALAQQAQQTQQTQQAQQAKGGAHG